MSQIFKFEAKDWTSLTGFNYSQIQRDFKEELINILVRKSFKYTEEPTFKLVSGAISRYYVNCKPTTMGARAGIVVGRIVFEMIKDLMNISCVGGLEFGAYPIAQAAAMTAGFENRNIGAFMVRKQPKQHGTMLSIEGDVHSGQHCVIVDDVATTGGSTIKAIEMAEKDGLIVVKTIILVDRQEGGLDNIRKHCQNVEAVVTRDELLAAYKLINPAKVINIGG